MEAVLNCVVVKSDGIRCSNSDHLPVRCELLLDTGQSAPSVDGSTDGDVTQSSHMKQPTYVKPKWTDTLFVATYTHNLRQELSKIPPLEPHRVDRDNAQCVIDSHINLINRAMHVATRAGLSPVTPSGKTKRRVHWWTSDCTMAETGLGSSATYGRSSEDRSTAMPTSATARPERHIRRIVVAQ